MDITGRYAAKEKRITIQPLHIPNDQNIKVDMLRLELLDEVVSGNKWYKLRCNIEYAVAHGFSTILSFGGGHSNHLVAAAAAAKEAGLHSIGVIRGVHSEENFTPTLTACKELGMHLHFISRAEYDQKTNEEFLAAIAEQFGGPYIIPEGGANELGRKGAGSIAQFITSDYDNICLSVGTGTTFAGLREALPVNRKMIGFAPMKGGKYLEDEIREWLLQEHDANWNIVDEYHFGGFGKTNDVLIQYMLAFQQEQGFALDRVYTAKMMYGVEDMISRNLFPEGSKILCIHTGGLQGNG